MAEESAIWSEPPSENEIQLMKNVAARQNKAEMLQWLNFAIRIFEAQVKESNA